MHESSDCPHCGGEGWIPQFTTIFCTACNGHMFHTVTNNCTSCGGWGEDCRRK